MKRLLLTFFIVALFIATALALPAMANKELEVIDQCQQPREFVSLYEFLFWLFNDDTDKHEHTYDFQCGDFAAMLQEQAIEDGYIVNIYPLPHKLHTVNMVRIDRAYYYIEPQNDLIYLHPNDIP